KPQATPAGRLLFQLAVSMPGTDETEFGLWQSPMPSDVDGGRTTKGKLRQNETGLRAQAMWPTPTGITDTGGAALCKWGGAGARAQMKKMCKPGELNGSLNPTWVEWLMGYPPGWT